MPDSSRRPGAAHDPWHAALLRQDATDGAAWRSLATCHGAMLTVACSRRGFGRSRQPCNLPRRSVHAVAIRRRRCRRPPSWPTAAPGWSPRQRRASMPANFSARRARRRPGPDHLCGSFDLPDREPAARPHRHRLQRLCPAAGPARHRDDEPRALDPLHRPARSRDQARAARMGTEPGPAGAPRHDLSGRARAQRAHQHPQLGRRRHRAPRQFDLHLRDGADVHRPSRPSAPHAQPAAAQRDGPRRHRDGAGRRQRDARPRRHVRGAARPQGAADDPDALLQRLHAQPLPRARQGAMGRGSTATRPRS